MPAKRVHSDENARRAIRRGIDTRANAVEATRGAQGRNLVLDKKGGAPSITKDDVTVRKMAPPRRRYWPSPSSTERGRP